MVDRIRFAALPANSAYPSQSLASPCNTAVNRQADGQRLALRRTNAPVSSLSGLKSRPPWSLPLFPDRRNRTLVIGLTCRLWEDGSDGCNAPVDERIGYGCICDQHDAGGTSLYRVPLLPRGVDNGHPLPRQGALAQEAFSNRSKLRQRSDRINLLKRHRFERAGHRVPAHHAKNSSGATPT